MGEKEMEREAPAAAKVSAIASRRPTITVPPRAPFESIFAGGSIPGYSPGPMTLLSNIFSPDSNSCSFSQLLAGAMASPIGKPTFLATTGDYSSDNSSKDVNFADGNDKGLGYKQNRPMGLMVAQSPLFLVPPGLSPSGFLNSPGFLSPLQSPFGMSHQQALAHVTAQAALSQSFVQIQADFRRASSTTSVEAVELQPSSLPSETLQVHTVVPSDPQSLKMGSSEASQFDKKPVSSALDKPANDGYNWRKYGQKLVKAKEHPRSYYKCTHPQCPVKKKVERATDGQITEITYKGQHNHEVPQPNTRTKYGSGLDGTVSSRVKPEFGTRARTEIETSNEAATSHLIDLQHKVCTQLSSEPVPVVSEHDEMEDSATVIDEDNDVDEPNAKRRNMEVRASVPVPSHKTITEPKIVVQTRSEVDLLDDGFKWRKYGQKVVKGNPHPRSYYRCTFTGCNVRKHVERASADPKEVITTYEGKHNHDIPAARNSSHIIVNTTAQLKPQKAVAKKPSLYREVDFQNKDQIPVLPQLKEGKIAA